ncbi:MAG: hypothetical protein GWN53_17335 [Gammaproteobacteria bacterium]|uniref:Uncharacterized protein n=1 Tax=Candidatus Kutchimonas denitrificans TaxID=3056748 RepID=A0AAE4ZAU2_9BACT|nr:hypothetical protein [Candidatus Kutchimonas denitrificans]NIV53606.1 hypothetical protein [Gammaproteobacteria bacterium]
MPKRIGLTAGDTEPLELTIGARGESNLDNVSTVQAYFWRKGQNTNLVNAAAAGVSDSANKEISFPPAGATTTSGNAFGSSGMYLGYFLVTWSDGETTRHPNGDTLEVEVAPNRE